MFSIFKNKDGLIKNRLELVSIHIPKTAGTSFRGVLKEVYGEQEVIRLDIGLIKQELRINEVVFSKNKLSKNIRVAHGHFSPALLKAHFEIAPEVPFITWLRDPIERVISNYFYLQKRLKEELEEEKKGLNILSKMQRSLLEYAQSEINQNRMSKFLEGIELEELFFIGIQDYFAEDLQFIAQKLQWPPIQELKYNITGRKNDQVSPEERQQIADLNQKDVALYEKALSLRSKRT
ncbi:MAG: sulfotransferase family 2 domain-containing protein [Saprospiraceae bacterium]|nr:sulfotransferase family 2 domain-containing protein [Saprospiraceae bacterium]